MNKYFIFINRDSTNIYRYNDKEFAGIRINDCIDIPNIVYSSLDSNAITIDLDSKLFDQGRYQLFSPLSKSGGLNLPFHMKFKAFIDVICGSIEQADNSEKDIYIILGFLPDIWFTNFDISKFIKDMFNDFRNIYHYNIRNNYFMYKYYLVLGLFSYISSTSKESMCYIDNDMIVDSTINKKGNSSGFAPWNSKEVMNNSKFIDYLNQNGIELHDEIINNIINFTNFLSKENKDEIELSLCDERIIISCKSIIEEKNRCYDEAINNLNEIIKSLDNKCNLCIDFTDELIIEKFKKLEINNSKIISGTINIELILKYAMIVAENSNRANIMRTKKEGKLSNLEVLDMIYYLYKFYYLTNRKKNDDIIKKLGLK